MQLVAAQNAQGSGQDVRNASYADKMRQVIGHLHHAHPEYKHSFMKEREVKAYRLHHRLVGSWSLRRSEQQSVQNAG